MALIILNHIDAQAPVRDAICIFQGHVYLCYQLFLCVYKGKYSMGNVIFHAQSFVTKLANLTLVPLTK